MIQIISDTVYASITILHFLHLTFTSKLDFYVVLTMFSNNFHSHKFNKEESKTALYGTKVTVPECTVCPASNHANRHTSFIPGLALSSQTHAHVHKNTYTQKQFTDIHTVVTATTVYTVLS